MYFCARQRITSKLFSIWRPAGTKTFGFAKMNHQLNLRSHHTSRSDFSSVSQKEIASCSLNPNLPKTLSQVGEEVKRNRFPWKSAITRLPDLEDDSVGSVYVWVYIERATGGSGRGRSTGRQTMTGASRK